MLSCAVYAGGGVSATLLYGLWGFCTGGFCGPPPEECGEGIPPELIPGEVGPDTPDGEDMGPMPPGPPPVLIMGGWLKP